MFSSMSFVTLSSAVSVLYDAACMLNYCQVLPLLNKDDTNYNTVVTTILVICELNL